MRKLGIIILLIIVAAVAVVAYTDSRRGEVQVLSFEDCIAAGYPIMESYPRQCRTPDGELFVEDIEMSGDVINVNIEPNSVVQSPLLVTGEARGNWFFEANIRLLLENANGNVIGQTGAQAQGEWMTTDYVPFRGTITFAQPTTTTGTLVIANDNPSGLPENERRFEIPVRFTSTATQGNMNPGSQLAECRPTGCSGHICSDQNVVSTCEFKEEYACYRTTNATCERQSNGSCGWTPSSALTMCINNARAGENS